ncbi:MAG: nuclease-related domain-containing protein [Solirubrobacteraceae bacterium]
MSQVHDNSDSAPGASAQREYARRQQARRQRVRARYGPVGSLVAALAGEPRNVDAWRQGAEGEAATARALEWRLHRSDVVLMHDRRVPGRGRANIDHIAIGLAGVTVIDTKSSRGRVQLASVGIINRREQLLVNGRDRTSQLDSLQRQMERVAGVLVQNDAGDVSVFGALCFPFMRREWLHYSRARDGLITVDDPAHIAKLVKRAGLLTVDEVAWLAETLAAAFPPWPDPIHRSTCSESWWLVGTCRVGLPPASNGADA